jgi:hypothetical protein
MAHDELVADSNLEAENTSPAEDLPQEITESYGTGVQPQPELNVGQGSMPDEVAEYTITTPGLTAAEEDAWHQGDLDVDEVGNSPVLTGGDIDAAWEQAAMVGDEAVGGTVATPDQDIVDEIGAAVGLEMDDNAFLRTNEILEERDDRRWDLDPMSSEDYQDRRD